MENKIRLSLLSSSLKWAICAYVLLTCLGFSVAGVMSYSRYSFSHEKTAQFYLGDPAEGEAVFKKPYAELVGVTHVHSYTMPLVFFVLWVLLQGVPLSCLFRKIMVVGGASSIMIYNIAPYMLRFVSPHWVFLFTIGGVGLFVFYFLPAFFVLKETCSKSD